MLKNGLWGDIADHKNYLSACHCHPNTFLRTICIPTCGLWRCSEAWRYLEMYLASCSDGFVPKASTGESYSSWMGWKCICSTHGVISYHISYHISYLITVYQVFFPMLLSKETPCKRHQGVRHKKLGRCWKWNRQEYRISIVDLYGKLPQKTTGKITMLLMGKLTITGVFSIDLLMFTRPGIENDPSRDDSQKKNGYFQ